MGKPSVGSCCPTKAGCVSERTKNSSDSLLNSRSKPELAKALGVPCSWCQCWHQAGTSLLKCRPESIFQSAALSHDKYGRRTQSGRCSGVIASVECVRPCTVMAVMHPQAPTACNNCFTEARRLGAHAAAEQGAGQNSWVSHCHAMR